MRVIRPFVLLPLVSTLALLACGGSDSTPTPPTSTNKTVDVFTLSTAFSPNFVQLAQGDTIRFNITPSSNGEGHDVTFTAKPGVPANIPVTKTGVITRVFNTKGTFHFDCFVHPGMSGDVLVQ
jgi:plastocyanin